MGLTARRGAYAENPRYRRQSGPSMETLFFRTARR